MPENYNKKINNRYDNKKLHKPAKIYDLQV